MEPLAPLAHQIVRFRRDYEALVGAPARLGVAVSGGPDSLALLLLAGAAWPGHVAAATVDHGLRPESAAEAEAVAALCKRLGCPHNILKVAVPTGGDGLQGEARRARYAALRGWAEGSGIAALATAHHRDDQAETILMRLQRGAGLAGLSAIRSLRAEGPALSIVRPLLGWTRLELAGIVAAAGLTPASDPSNGDPRFDRVAIRAFLAQNPQFEPARLARSAAALAEADAALDWAAAKAEILWCSETEDGWTIDPADLPRALRRRLLKRAVAAISGREPGDVEGLLTALESGQTATLAGVIARPGACWRLSPAPPRREERTPR